MTVVLILMMILTSRVSSDDNPLLVLTGHLVMRSESGCEGDIVTAHCDSGYKVRQYHHLSTTKHVEE